jgi:sigma-B regulation protein RsbU (phosphoserine phosphatase)
VRLWRVEEGRVRALGGAPAVGSPDGALTGERGHRFAVPGAGAAWVEPVPEVPGTWLQLGPGPLDEAARARRARAAAAVLGRGLAAERESAQVTSELMSRYEEINLLYGISEILGRTVHLEEAADTIVREVATVVGARRASIMVHDVDADLLRVVAAWGVDLPPMTPVSVDDECSVAARAFRSQTAIGAEETVPRSRPCPETRPYRGRAFLSVPIVYGSAEGGPRPIGVINLTDRLGEDTFSAGDRKLIAAIATQIGAAIENARLVGEERRQARIDAELAAAQNVQRALLPSPALLSRAGDVGVRFQSAESVSGDFYDVIPRGRSSVGVFIGDVASHGFSAALLMAHTVSAAAILAQVTATPEEALRRLLEVVGEELERAEMSMSLFFGVVYPERRTLRYANAGHPGAFVVPGDGGPARRLGATAPPLGLAASEAIAGAEVPWHPGKDLLCLFTDGLTDARNAAGAAFGERRLLQTVVQQRARPAQQLVDHVFAELEAFTDLVQDDRTLLILRR